MECIVILEGSWGVCTDDMLRVQWKGDTVVLEKMRWVLAFAGLRLGLAGV